MGSTATMCSRRERETGNRKRVTGNDSLREATSQSSSNSQALLESRRRSKNLLS